jgi:hypothetical protein
VAILYADFFNSPVAVLHADYQVEKAIGYAEYVACFPNTDLVFVRGYRLQM